MSPVLVRALGQLPQRWVTAPWPAEAEGRPLEDIGARIGAEQGATAVLPHRAREGMRQAFLRTHPGAPDDPARATHWDRMPAYSAGLRAGRRGQVPAAAITAIGVTVTGAAVAAGIMLSAGGSPSVPQQRAVTAESSTTLRAPSSASVKVSEPSVAGSAPASDVPTPEATVTSSTSAKPQSATPSTAPVSPAPVTMEPTPAPTPTPMPTANDPECEPWHGPIYICTAP